jgi:hypothetical protein
MLEPYTTIFYPLNLHLIGYVYGWNVSRSTLCIAGVIQCDLVELSLSALFLSEASRGFSENKLKQS